MCLLCKQRLQNTDWSYFSKRYFQGSFKSFSEVPKLPENEEGEVPKDETEKKRRWKSVISQKCSWQFQKFDLNSWKKQIFKISWSEKCQKSNNPSWRRKRPRCSNSSWAKATSRQLKGLKSKKNYLGSIE